MKLLLGLLLLVTVMALGLPASAQDAPVSPLPTPEPTWIVDPNNSCGGMVPAQCHAAQATNRIFFPLIGGSNE